MQTPDITAAWRALVADVVREVLPVLLAEVAPQLARRDDETIDAARFATDGLGTARQFADAARLGHFPTFKGGATGRARVAKRSDVLAWLATRTVKRTRPAPNVANDTDEPSTFADAYASIAKRAG